ncbi:hypothetical protein [Actinopolymorpha rutila]|uniref:Uncharacterized protein n=1 Tax=Actinopolymorpha rutila TaxID=446787 RepID=A0A852ZQM8_9ACTN|nr:hypothetical protein [Actinopolymorpha rutila]NYH90836.1 hypothetical protein [Actinopolymorpha rutila]
MPKVDEFLLNRLDSDETVAHVGYRRDHCDVQLDHALEVCTVRRRLVWLYRTASGVDSDVLLDVVKRFAALYSQHPDYDPAWHPGL